MKQIVTKGVTFNLADPDQFLLYKHASARTNFSGYVKRLIQRDCEGATAIVASAPRQNVNRSMMQSLLK